MPTQKPNLRRITPDPRYEITLNDVERHAALLVIGIEEDDYTQHFAASLPPELAAMEEQNLWDAAPAVGETEAALYDRIRAFRVAKWLVRETNLEHTAEEEALMVSVRDGRITEAEAITTFRSRILAELRKTLMERGYLTVLVGGRSRAEEEVRLIAA